MTTFRFGRRSALPFIGAFALTCLVSLCNTQYMASLSFAESAGHGQAMPSFSGSNSTSPFLLNFVDKDIALFSRDSNMYDIKEGSDYFRSIFARYLQTGSYQSYLVHCHNHYDKFSQITPSQISAAIQASIEEIQRYRASDTDIIRNTESARFASRFIQQLAWETRFAELITENLIKFNCINKLEAVIELPKFGIAEYAAADVLAKNVPVTCQAHADIKLNCNFASKYPAYDNSCNHKERPRLGMSYTCHRRLLPADYADGVKAVRRSITGQPLPNGRLLANDLLPDINEVNSKHSIMLMQWGQSIVHDQTRTPISLGNSAQCCPPLSQVHPECDVVAPLPKGDPLIALFNQSCFRQVRSSPCSACSLGPRDQLNVATMNLDLSHLYGYTYNDVIKYRTLELGQMITVQDPANQQIMPKAFGWFDPITLQACNIPKQYPEFQCFRSGDGTRASQHPGIAALQTLFLRRHNNHALALHAVNPHWNDEKLFLEARRLVVAETNHITYNEYMVETFSEELLNYFKLRPNPHGYSKYDPHVDISSIIEWTTAAGRFGHSQINNVFTVKNPNGEVYTYNMRDVFFETSLIHLGQTDGIIKGLTTEPVMQVDPFFAQDVKDFMYHNPNRTGGLDLLTLNIHRGRDHGIPGYIYYLDYCFSYKVKDWPDLLKYIPERQVWRLQKYYADVRDIDLFVGGVSERRLQGNVMGPTFACINGIQWFHVKYGDRYFYEHGGEAGSFTPEQLANIKGTTSLARLICKTATTLKSMHPWAMRMPNDHDNAEIPCDHYPELDYNLWKDDYDTYKKK